LAQGCKEGYLAGGSRVMGYKKLCLRWPAQEEIASNCSHKSCSQVLASRHSKPLKPRYCMDRSAGGGVAWSRLLWPHVADLGWTVMCPAKQRKASAAAPCRNSAAAPKAAAKWSLLPLRWLRVAGRQPVLEHSSY